MRSDLIAAYRSLTASKTFTAAAVAVLALGIGATTAIYSVVDGVLLRPLPFHQPERLVAVREHRPSEDPQNVYSIAPQNFRDWDAESDVFEALAAFARSISVLSAPDTEPEDVRTLRTTADLFDVFRVTAARGRLHRVDEETEGRHRVAVLSDAFWRRRYGAALAAIGQTLTLDDEAFEIIGVLPPSVAYLPGSDADLFLPLVVPAEERVRTSGVSASYLTVVGRLRTEVPIESARSRMEAVAARLRTLHPEWNGQSHVRVVPLTEDLVGADWASWLWMLFVGAVSVLLIACVNVTVLQLSRASAREHEMGVRAALGGSRWRLVRQLLVEHVLLALCGAAVALLIAWWGVEVLRTSLHGSLPRLAAVALDYRVLAMMAAVALTCGVASGLAPAWHLSSPHVASGLRDGARMVAGRASRRVGRGLVVIQVATALVLLVAASLCTRSVLAVSAIDPGFTTDRLLTAAIFPQRGPMPRGNSSTIGRSRAPIPVVDHGPAYLALVDRLRQSPGIEHAAFVSGGVPLGGAIARTSMVIAGRPTTAEEYVMFRSVTEDYYQILDIPMLAGRAFVQADRTRGAPAAVVNASFASTYFDGRETVGRTVSIAGRDHEVVGVAADVRGARLETPPEAEVTVLLPTEGQVRGGEVIVRTVGDPAVAITSLRAAAAEVFPGVPIRRLRTMEDVVADQSTWRRLDMWIVNLFAALGLVIAAVGIFGALAYGVERRTREIGVRMALGASPREVLHLVLGETGRVVVAGLIAGGLGAWWLSSAVESYLFGVPARDPVSFTVATLTMAIVALVAAAVPAWRAASVRPTEALRAE